ncbi:TraB/GumN family protein [Paucibacter sp. KBW04]|nr:TraB/GumN family protein [Paucibacter sp. KBW04]
MPMQTPVLRLLRAALLLLLAKTGWAAPACPPQPQAPTAAQIQSLAASAPDRGFLYRLRRDGHDSYLYGTLHLGRMEWIFPGPQLRKAMGQAERLALELDLSDPATLQALTQPPAHAKPMPLTPDLRHRLAAQSKAACLPDQGLGQLHPLLQLSHFAGLVARWDGMDPAFGQELMLSAWAGQRGLPISALESVETQLQVLIPSDPEEAQAHLRKGLEQLEKKQLRPMLRRLAQAWAKSDLDTLAGYETWCQCVADAKDLAELRELNDGRNPGLARRIAELHGQGQVLLAAVGSLHLTGEQALPRLLVDLGFEVHRLH